ncbi:MAG: DNA gyrase inhibitor YacG [Nitrospinaceae bacterium]|nr:MAG: DNA gyrase inhibitor YacG [Nitrospinaceae bacterium]
MSGIKNNDKANQSSKLMPCPTCKNPVAAAKKNPFLPFCSERCKWADLGKWLDEKYVIHDPSTRLPENSAGGEND